MNETNSSQLLTDAVFELSKLPGIGNKTALRLALHLLKQDEVTVELFANSILKMKKEIKFCENCFNISDNNICDICKDTTRDKHTICVVENINDIIAIENTHQYKGLYHVLGGVISPMEGIGPSMLNISELIERIEKKGAKEIIFAMPTTMEGDTTAFYIYKKIKNLDCKSSSLAKGISIGNELQYTDEITLGQSILNRIPYNN